jgi:hypothetical protein
VVLAATGLSGSTLLHAAYPGTSLFTASPLALSDIASICPLGNLKPPGHVFPTDHIYFYLRRNAAGQTDDVPLYAPGAMTVTSVIASQHVTAGFTDFAIELSPYSGVTVVLGHVRSLRAEVFGDTSTFTGWDLVNEYSTGGETFRMWRLAANILVSGGQEIGTVGGNPGQWALDFGMYDDRALPDAVARLDRWAKSRALHAACPLDAYAVGPLRDALLARVERDGSPTDADRCGHIFQDVPGTAQGCWFASGVDTTYPEDPHLALVAPAVHPSQLAFSVGTSVPNLPSRPYTFAPASSSTLNRPFADVRPDGQIRAYRVDGFSGLILVHMPDANTLWIEAQPGATPTSTPWTFSGAKAVFRR